MPVGSYRRIVRNSGVAELARGLLCLGACLLRFLRLEEFVGEERHKKREVAAVHREAHLVVRGVDVAHVRVVDRLVCSSHGDNDAADHLEDLDGGNQGSDCLRGFAHRLR